MNTDNLISGINDIVAAAQNGDTEALVAYGMLKRIAATLDEGVSAVKELALEEVPNHLNKESGTFEWKGFKFEKRNGRALWKFDHIPAHVQAKATLSEIEETAKRAFELQQKGGNMADENGEVIEPAIFKGYAESSLSVK